MNEVIEKLKQEYAIQDNCATAYPIYVAVQELFCVGVMRDGYEASCPYGDGKTITKYRLKDGDRDASEFDSEEELKKYYKENDVEVNDDDIEEYQLGYIWVDREFFLTIKGAEEYMKANAHNHGELRTYVKHFERRNFEMRELLKAIGFKVEG